MYWRNNIRCISEVRDSLAFDFVTPPLPPRDEEPPLKLLSPPPVLLAVEDDPGTVLAPFSALGGMSYLL